MREEDEMGVWEVEVLPDGSKARLLVEPSDHFEVWRAVTDELGEPPLCTHWARVGSFDIGQEKPIRVTRVWDEKEYSVNCFVTEAVKDQYLSGDISIGDYVLVEFLEDRADRAVVFAKVLETW